MEVNLLHLFIRRTLQTCRCLLFPLNFVLRKAWMPILVLPAHICPCFIPIPIRSIFANEFIIEGGWYDLSKLPGYYDSRNALHIGAIISINLR